MYTKCLSNQSARVHVTEQLQSSCFMFSEKVDYISTPKLVLFTLRLWAGIIVTSIADSQRVNYRSVCIIHTCHHNCELHTPE